VKRRLFFFGVLLVHTLGLSGWLPVLLGDLAEARFQRRINRIVRTVFILDSAAQIYFRLACWTLHNGTLSEGLLIPVTAVPG
jgi:hypothetical protein